MLGNVVDLGLVGKTAHVGVGPSALVRHLDEQGAFDAPLQVGADGQARPVIARAHTVDAEELVAMIVAGVLAALDARNA